MKILQTIHGFLPYSIAGTEVYTFNLSQELAKRHKVFVFSRMNDLHMKEYTVSQTSLNSLEIFTINNTFRLYNSFEMTYKNEVIAEKFGSILDQIKPDIVHIQHLLYLSGKIIEEIKKRRIPIVFTLHDYWLICPQGQLLKNNKEICNDKYLECINCVLHQLSIKKNIFNAYYFLKELIPGSLFQLIKNFYLGYSKFIFLTKEKANNLIEARTVYMKDICSKVDLFISPSNFLKNKFIEFGIPQDKIIFLPHGFNLENFKKLQKTSSPKLRFAFIGNILPAKGVHMLIECFNKIKNDNVELKIYGKAISYKSELRNYLKYIKKIIKSKNIKFMGGFDNRNIAKIFEEIDVLVVPPIWYENSPLVIQEAFAAKTPIVASDIGGISELINHNVNGFLFKPNDVNDLYEKINLIIKKPNLIEEIKQNINPPKSIKKNAEEISNIYEDLLIQC